MHESLEEITVINKNNENGINPGKNETKNSSEFVESKKLLQ